MPLAMPMKAISCLIAGKGHEEYQDIGGNRMVFSDVKQARVSLNNRFAEQNQNNNTAG